MFTNSDMIMRISNYTTSCKRSYRRKSENLFVSVMFILFAFLIVSCGDGSTTSSGKESTGAVSFELVWVKGDGNIPRSSAVTKEANPDICADQGIQTIYANIQSTGGTSVGSATWACSTHQGVIQSVPVGSNYTLKVEGRDSGGASKATGQTTGIGVQANITTSATVTLTPVNPQPGAAYDIVYLSDKSGKQEIWKTKSTDSTQQIQVSNFAGSFTTISPPKWSPNGNWIAFAAQTSSNSDAEIYVIKTDGTGGPVALTSYKVTYNIDIGASLVDFGSDSDWVYFLRGIPTVNTMIYRVSISTKTIQPINADTTKTIHTYDISDDGSYRLEMRENGCCWSPNNYTVLYNLTTGTNATILPTDGNYEGNGRISPDNKKIVYAQYAGYQAPSNLWIMNADGTGKTKLTSVTSSAIDIAWPAWNGDGTKIVYSYRNGPVVSLYMWDVAAGTSSVFLTGAANYDAPDWLH